MTPRPVLVQQLYVTAAVVAFAATFAPLWVPSESAAPGSDIGRYSLWTVVPTDGGGAAVGGLLLLFVMIGLTLAAAVLPASVRAVPVAMIVVAAIAFAMLLAKPDTGGDADFGPGAGLMFGATIIIIVSAITDLLAGFLPREHDAAAPAPTTR